MRRRNASVCVATAAKDLYSVNLQQLLKMRFDDAAAVAESAARFAAAAAVLRLASVNRASFADGSTAGGRAAVVQSHVRAQVAGAGEATFALWTAVRPLTGVNEVVFLQVRQLSESLVADLARERSFAAVRPEVNLCSFERINKCRCKKMPFCGLHALIVEKNRSKH